LGEILLKNTNFALIGAAGFIAPRHLKAIKDADGVLVAAVDPNDSVGILDSYFPESDFFVEFERFDRHLEKLKRSGSDKAVQYVSICSPNYLHDAHIRFALRTGAHAICEKPLVLNPWNIDALKEIEAETGQKIFTVLQLRLHPSILKLKEEVKSAPKDKTFDFDLTYITSRGNWYHYSWKGDEKKSGGIATNIGVHFFDMLSFVFGKVTSNKVHHRDEKRAAGFLELERARVRWFLSVEANDLPENVKAKGQRTFRSLRIDEKEIEFSDGFSELHSHIYRDIVSGGGFGVEDNRAATEVVATIRSAAPLGLVGEYHPLLRQIQK